MTVLDGELGLSLLARDDQRHRHAVVFQDDGADLAGGALAHAQNIVDPGLLQASDGGGADQAAVGDDAGAGDGEALAHALDHRQEQGDVGGVAGQQERGDRSVGAVEHDAQHHLGEVAAIVLGVAAPAERRPAAALEPQRRGVEEGHRQFAQQRLAVTIERLLHGLAHHSPVADILAQPRHRLVGVVEVERLRPGQAIRSLPGAGMAVGAGDHQPVHHGEIDRPLHVEAELAPGERRAQHLATAGLGPQPTEHQVRPDATAPQLGQLAPVVAGQDDGAAGMAGGRGDQAVERAGGLDLVAALCRHFGISRKTGHKWLARYRADGGAGLVDRARAPRSNPRTIAEDVVAAVLSVRQRHPSWGRGR